MNTIAPSANAPEAGQTHAFTKLPTQLGMGMIAHQPPFAPVSRRDLMNALNICARELGLRQTSLVVLDALMSCLPCPRQDGLVDGATLLTIYASNETLCFRAKGLTDRQLRRHFDILERAELIQRRDSANGKRFPIMKSGRVIGAFGIDLSPLFAKSAALLAKAETRRHEAAELRGLRAQILHMRGLCADLSLDETTQVYLDGLRNLLRRASLTLTEARIALSAVSEILSGSTVVPAEEFEAHPETATENQETHAEVSAKDEMVQKKTPASDGQNVRHKEPQSESKIPTTEGNEDWSSLSEASQFYPEPRSLREAEAIAYAFGGMLRIKTQIISLALRKLGAWRVLQLQDHLARRIESVICPSSYLSKLLDGQSRKSVSFNKDSDRESFLTAVKSTCQT